MTQINDIVKACCVCHAIEIKGEYIKHDEVFYVLIGKTYRYSHGFCSPECLSEGTGIDYFRAKEIWVESKDV